MRPATSGSLIPVVPFPTLLSRPHVEATGPDDCGTGDNGVGGASSDGGCTLGMMSASTTLASASGNNLPHGHPTGHDTSSIVTGGKLRPTTQEGARLPGCSWWRSSVGRRPRMQPKRGGGITRNEATPPFIPPKLVLRGVSRLVAGGSPHLRKRLPAVAPGVSMVRTSGPARAAYISTSVDTNNTTRVRTVLMGGRGAQQADKAIRRQAPNGRAHHALRWARQTCARRQAPVDGFHDISSGRQ
jgi:hypothetical protein